MYYGIFPDGNYIKKHRLEDLILIPGIEYYLKIESSPGNYLDCIFTLVKKDETLHFLRIGNVELRDISTGIYDKALNKRKATVTLYDYNKEQTTQKDIVTNGDPKFIKDELIPLMRDLGNDKSENTLTELETLKIENDNLKHKLDLLTNQLNPGVFKLN